MNGNYSRLRGRRGEYLLRDYLRTFGWTADRVPLSGASQGFKGDIRAGDPRGKPYTFELKVRGGKYFDSLYNSPYNFVNIDGQLVSFGTSLNDVMHNPCDMRFITVTDRNHSKLITMKKWLESCDILAVKHDRKPFLFIKYWD